MRPSELGIDLNSMRVCILPAATKPEKQPRLKFVERVVFLTDSPEMELIIYGNNAGYLELAECYEYACTQYLNDPSDHMHLDDYMDRRIVRRSVALNIRGPLESWSRGGLKNYGAFVFERQSTYVPDDIEYLTKKLRPYYDPVPGEMPFVLR
ncbi:MAG: hypothetical protein IIA09_14615 [Proteobacteria bacterium]|nr:hypothetical protein [Pseudomonadota bacterium]